jgi:Thioredoxin
MAPAYERAAGGFEPDHRLLKVNTEEERSLSGRYGIRSIPTLVLLLRGREVAPRAGGAIQLRSCPGRERRPPTNRARHAQPDKSRSGLRSRPRRMSPESGLRGKGGQLPEECSELSQRHDPRTIFLANCAASRYSPAFAFCWPRDAALQPGCPMSAGTLPSHVESLRRPKAARWRRGRPPYCMCASVRPCPKSLS